ncbi:MULTISPECIES: Holliday junction branch migration protein RuvA [unclassified Microbacterium]|uniref:Holliday junction branch migration protein RuvA n=1 Tax=unclassified Microbacterium TaxID=2609290 RepID=UPI00214ABE39|nr:MULTISPECIES: Holliday junction branch migration protein RuvA [unclassified Microbacterium]MCR2800852.1 Holliday junction branch migration protein RuvA [Microbacterium sp. zg.Y818]MCR2825959.1 Holliday junction branch migration protein RuvA [Microbacterium sp. zg.Y909]WIM23567.1 Holliday junction branch migration protein RuvA [Microbacterium sp. zg-Y818]
MISSARGRVLHLDPDSVIVDVNGVGFSIAVTPQLSRSFHVGDEIVLHTHLVVREDALALFGFATRDELSVFLQLISVSGVGPKSALGVLASLTVDQIAQAVTAEDDAPFRRVSGIGPKTAKLIVVQLAGKLQALGLGGTGGAVASGKADEKVVAQVVAALVGLGWSERIAAEAVGPVAEAASERQRGDVSALLRLTLAQLGPSRKEPAGG